MSKYISEQVYAITYNSSGASYESIDWYIADSIEDAVAMCRDRHKDCNIKEVRKVHNVHRKSTKTITVNV